MLITEIDQMDQNDSQILYLSIASFRQAPEFQNWSIRWILAVWSSRWGEVPHAPCSAIFPESSVYSLSTLSQQCLFTAVQLGLAGELVFSAVEI